MNNFKKIFISQPMKGKTSTQILSERRTQIKELRKKFGEDIKIIDNFFPNAPEENPIKMLGKSIELMAEADLVCFMKNWDRARGCLIEHQVAYHYNIECIYTL